MEYKKHSFVSWDEQLQILNENHNIGIVSVIDGLNSIKNYSYYTLINGYQQALEKNKGSEEFIDGITLDQLSFIHLIETRLSSELLHSIITIETKMKSIFQHEISKTIGYKEDDYLDKKHYITRKESDKSKTLKILRNKANTSFKVSRSIKKYRADGNVPPWILINEITFGEFKHWYSISPSKVKRSVSLEFDFGFDDQNTNAEFFKQSLNFLLDYRNGLAHGDVINKIIPKHHLAFDKLKHFYGNNIVTSSEYTKQGYGKNDLFGLILLINIFLPPNEKEITKRQIIGFLEIFDGILPIDEAPMRRILSNIPPDIIKRINNVFK